MTPAAPRPSRMTEAQAPRQQTRGPCFTCATAHAKWAQEPLLAEALERGKASELQAEAVWLRVCCKLPPVEVAGYLDTTISSAQRLVRRARARVLAL